MNQALVYGAEVSVRFADLDAYGHVNASHYLDFVVTSRWSYMSRTFGVSAEDLAKRSLGFYMTRSQIEYRKAISGLQTLWIESFVTSQEKAFLSVDFKIASLDRSTIYARGTLDLVAIHLETGKPQRLPSWALGYFLEQQDRVSHENQGL